MGCQGSCRIAKQVIALIFSHAMPLLILFYRGYSEEVSAAFAQEQCKLKQKAAYKAWSHSFYSVTDSISPLRGALAVFGLTPNDIGRHHRG